MSTIKTIAIGAVCAVAASAATGAAASLITSKDIKDGTVQGRDIHKAAIGMSRLTPAVQQLIRTKGQAVGKGLPGLSGPAGATGAGGAKGDTGPAGPAGVQGAKGDTGPAGVQGAKGDTGLAGPAGAKGETGLTGPAGSTGPAGADGAPGAPGRDGKDGFNPAVQVMKSGDAGWSLSGAPSARLVGGELRLGGGFDSSTVAGGIGMTKPYANVPLSTLTSLSYSFHVNKRPNAVSAPTIHVAVTGASTLTGSTFMNLVYEPANNGGAQVGLPYTLDARSGAWWGTKDTTNHPRQATASLDSFIADNPGAKIIAISVDNGGSSVDTIPAADFDAGVDNLVVGFDNGFDRYDFGG